MKLKVKHVFLALDIIKDVLPEIKAATDGSKKAEDVGMDIVRTILSRGADRAWALLADVAELSVDEFNEKPIDFIPNLIKDIGGSAELRGFLSLLQDQIKKA
jgi:hypothetical protein